MLYTKSFEGDFNGAQCLARSPRQGHVTSEINAGLRSEDYLIDQNEIMAASMPSWKVIIFSYFFQSCIFNYTSVKNYNRSLIVQVWHTLNY